MRQLQCKAAKLAASKLVQKDFCHALSIHLTAGDQKPPLAAGSLQQPVTPGNIVFLLLPLRKRGELVSRHDGIGIIGAKVGHEMAGQCFNIQNIVFHRAGEGKVQSYALVLELGPEDAGGIQQLKAAVDGHPLLGAGDAGTVLRLGGLAAGHLIDKGGFAHVGNAQDHHPDHTAHLPLFGVGLELLETPGILWPKFEDQSVGLNLAFTGAVKDDILDIETLGCHLMTYLARQYPEALKTAYKLPSLPEREEEENDIAWGYRLLEAAGRKRGFLISGGEVDTERMAKILLDEFRGGKLGRFTLELPQE